jgi:hypothetical protein
MRMMHSLLQELRGKTEHIPLCSILLGGVEWLESTAVNWNC